MVWDRAATAIPSCRYYVRGGCGLRMRCTSATVIWYHCTCIILYAVYLQYAQYNFFNLIIIKPLLIVSHANLSYLMLTAMSNNNLLWNLYFMISILLLNEVLLKCYISFHLLHKNMITMIGIKPVSYCVISRWFLNNLTSEDVYYLTVSLQMDRYIVILSSLNVYDTICSKITEAIACTKWSKFGQQSMTNYAT